MLDAKYLCAEVHHESHGQNFLILTLQMKRQVVSDVDYLFHFLLMLRLVI